MPLRGQHDVAQVAVAELADALREWLLRGALDELVRRPGLFPERLPPREAGGVRQDVQQCDPILRATAKIRHELTKRCLERQRLVADERQHERGRRELRERGEVEERVRRAWCIRSSSRIGTERARCITVD